MIRRLGLGLLIAVIWGALSPLLGAQYHYSYLPKSTYATQVFPVTILARHANPSQKVSFTFDPTSPNQPVSVTPVIAQNGADLFFTFYFQAPKDERIAHLPSLDIHESNASYTLDRKEIPVHTLDHSAQKDFCGLIATDCKVLSSQVSLFDTNTTLVSVTFQAHGANPSAIHIPNVLEQGTESVKRAEAKTTIEYYFVLPFDQKEITLSYYNTVQRRFLSTTIATDYQNQPVAAQTELNPQVSPFVRLKQYGSIALLLFFALMFWWQRGWLYMLLVLVTLLLIFLVYKPRELLCVREGTRLFVLPSNNSRTSTTISTELTTRSLGEYGLYYKIKYRKGIIGWIRNEDLCEN